jgi:ribosomal protein L36
MTYEPQVNDYVVWSKGVEGWVYFKDREYITIEYVVRPKDEVNLECCPIHRNERLLVICYNNQWKELQYIKSRQSIYEETENCLATAC